MSTRRPCSRVAPIITTPSWPSRRPANRNASSDGVVEPLRVVDHDQHGPLVGGAREQRQQRGGHGEAVRRCRRPERERTADRRRLHAGQLVEVREQRRDELGEARRTGCRTRTPSRAPRSTREVRRLLDRPPQQRGLADPGRPVQQQRAAAPFARGVEERLQAGSLVLAADHGARSLCAVGRRLAREFASGSKPVQEIGRRRRGAQPERARHPGHRVGRRDLAQRHVAVALREPPPVRRPARAARARTSAPPRPARAPARSGAAWSRPGRRRARPRRCPARRRRPRPRGCRRTRRRCGARRSRRRRRSAAPAAGRRSRPGRRRRGRAARARGPRRAAPPARHRDSARHVPGYAPRAPARAPPTRSRGSRRACRSTRRPAAAPTPPRRARRALGLHDAPRRPSRGRSPRGRRAAPARAPAARGPCRDPRSASRTAPRPSARTATRAARSAGCRGAGRPSARARSGRRGSHRERQRVRDLRQPRGRRRRARE